MKSPAASEGRVGFGWNRNGPPAGVLSRTSGWLLASAMKWGMNVHRSLGLGTPSSKSLDISQKATLSQLGASCASDVSSENYPPISRVVEKTEIFDASV